VDFERIMGAIQWRLGSLPEEADAGQDWERIENWLRGDLRRLEVVANIMAEPLVEIIRQGLLLCREDPKEGSLLPSRWWIGLTKYLQENPGISSSIKAAQYINANITDDGSSVPGKQTLPADDQPRQTEQAPQGSAPESASINAEEAQLLTASNNDESEAITLPLGSDSKEDQTTSTMNDEQESTDEVTKQPDSNPPSLSTQWRYLPVPDDPDKHEEFDQRADVSPEGLKIIGARVRGKKHKHEGTNCDDWFEFANSGSWTIIAVSDGAGSKAFSRVGARESCETALKELSDALGERPLKARDDWSNATFKRDKESGVFVAEDLEHVQQALHEAMTKAYAVVAAKALELAESPAHEAVLGRKVVVDDLSGTLLLAVHTTVTHEGMQRSFVMTCQIGDGMLAALTINGGLQLLGIPDSGEFAGQTEFLTSKKKLEKASLTGRTFPFFGPMQALMVMTDGVADDYFPNDPGMIRLYGDLAINGILVPRGLTAVDVDSSLSKTKLVDARHVEDAGLTSPVERILPDDRREEVFIRSFATYAEKLGLPPEEVIKSPALLVGGTAGDPKMCDDQNPEDMLRVWLDSYHVRGSFDDRTLVVLYREVAS
jgi:hypothetical protein